MKKKKQLITMISLSIFILLILLPMSAFASSNTVIRNDASGIPDKGLYQAILSQLGKKSNATFTRAEAAKITRLEAGNYYKTRPDIVNLKGIEYLTSLFWLDVNNNSVTNLTGLEKLPKLAHLNVAANKLTSLKGIENLTNLQELYISHNKLTSIQGVEKLTKLHYLTINDNMLTTLPDLRGLTSLTYWEGWFCFSNNQLPESEFRTKLPARLMADEAWMKANITLQNVVDTITLTSHESFEKIDRTTTRIAGKAHPNIDVWLLGGPSDPYSPYPFKAAFAKTTSDNQGDFSLDNLDLTAYAGMKFDLSAFYMDYFPGYSYMYHIVKSVRFTVLPSPFTDVPETHHYYKQVIGLYSQGIIDGKIAPVDGANGIYGIDEPVMRQQFAKMIIGSIDRYTSGDETCKFTDVDKTRPYPYSFVALCSNLGITLGVTPTKFNPYGNITRAQVATMIVRAGGDKLANPPSSYSKAYEKLLGAPHGANVRKAAYNGLFEGIQGMQDTTNWFFAPATRGEVAVMLYNLREKK